MILFERLPGADPFRQDDNYSTIDSAEELASALRRLLYSMRKMALNPHKLESVMKRAGPELLQIETLVKTINVSQGEESKDGNIMVIESSQEAAASRQLQAHDSDCWPEVDITSMAEVDITSMAEVDITSKAE
eukprot:3553253-Lingulodinium_polyedra.AAC.1